MITLKELRSSQYFNENINTLCVRGEFFKLSDAEKCKKYLNLKSIVATINKETINP